MDQVVHGNARLYEIEKNILYQDNMVSAILLEENGKKSSGKRTRALNIQYFFLWWTKSKKEMWLSSTVSQMTWSEIFTTSHYKARHFTNSEVRSLGADSSGTGTRRVFLVVTRA
jgi:hypothetical protein